MGENSKIEWTDHTFNAWIGCTKVSPGCANCYAKRDWDKRRHVAQWGPQGTRVVTSEDNWKKPRRWNKQAAEAGTRLRVFCNSLADVFEDWGGQVRHHSGVPMWKMKSENGHLFRWGAGHVLDDPQVGNPLTLDHVRQRLFHLIDETPHLDWILVTKRPENIFRMTPYNASSNPNPGLSVPGRYRQNVWLITSVENQEQADKRIPELLKCRDLSPFMGISAEPLLGPVDLTNRNGGRLKQHWNWLTGGYWQEMWDGGVGIVSGCPAKLDWVIVGGESGRNARPMHPEWVRSLRDQCHAAEVPYHFKQWGEYLPADEVPDQLYRHIRDRYRSGRCNPDLMRYFDESGELKPAGDGCSRMSAQMVRVGKKLAGRLLDGVEHNAFPGGRIQGGTYVSS